MSVTGSFDSISGTYAFQGRRFDVDPASSINFRGDLNPEIYVTVSRVISGVETRVSIFGPLQQPELRLASTPPLDESDILSLIVFNTSTNQLSAASSRSWWSAPARSRPASSRRRSSRRSRAKSASTSARDRAGRSFGAGPKVTIGEEIAPGLVARFSRQFGPEAYDEATIEYYLSRFLRLRAHLLRRAVVDLAFPVPPGRARGHRPAAVFQFLRAGFNTGADTWVGPYGDKTGA